MGCHLTHTPESPHSHPHPRVTSLTPTLQSHLTHTHTPGHLTPQSHLTPTPQSHLTHTPHPRVTSLTPTSQVTSLTPTPQSHLTLTPQVTPHTRVTPLTPTPQSHLTHTHTPESPHSHPHPPRSHPHPGALLHLPGWTAGGSVEWLICQLVFLE